jgi:uncharacterized membrane protein YgcG
MKKILRLSILLIVVLVLFQGFSFADEYYTIKKYDVKIDVTESNIYHIKETIDVSFSQPRHGIFREIPTTLYGYTHEISDIYVYDSLTGMSYNYEINYHGSEIQIKIGDADIYVDGNQSYLIEYVYNAGDDLIEEYDEFYFNIIGTQWNTPIDEVTFQINMPKGFDSNKLNITAGEYGSTGSDKVDWIVQGESIIGSASGLNPYEGVTIALNLEEGYYDDVAKPFSMIWIYLLIAMLIGLFGLAIYIRMSNYRRNTIIPILNFYSPKDLNPAEIAYVFNEEQIINKDMSSIIIYWASKGYLKIYEVEKSGLFGKESMYFERLVEPSQLGTGYEYHLFKDLFSHGDGNKVTVDELKHEFYQDLESARSLVKDQYKNDKEILENKFQYGIIIASFLVAVLTSVILSIYTRVLLGLTYLWAAVPTLAFLMIFWFVAFVIATRRKRKINKNKFIKILRYVIFIVIFGNVLIGLKTFIARIDFSSVEFGSLTTLMIISLVLYIITVFTISTVKRYSPFGKDLLNNIYGFKNFLETAKLDKLEMLFKDNPEYFYDMLPYVMVFDLTKIWDKTMQSLTLEGPSWYVSSHPFSTYYMMGMFNRSFTEMSAPPKSSSTSSFGGGSVGGGGGGGGGGSW